MSREEELKRINREIQQAQENYQGDDEWQGVYTALSTLCGSLDNRRLRTVLPKVVAVDRLYQADLIRYLPKPDEGEPDIRLNFYKKVAGAVIDISLDTRFVRLRERGSCLDISSLAEVVEIHTSVSHAVVSATNRSGDVFAAKYLHFCRPKYFPILDSKAEARACDILGRSDSDGNSIIAERFGYDEANDRYDRFCRAVLAMQLALADAGLGQCSLAELDCYLYGYQADSEQENHCG